MLAHRTAHDREILRLALPALGALSAEPIYVLIDTAIVGHLGTPELGGLGVASALILSGYWLLAFLAYGTTGTVARLLGAGDERRAAAQGVQGMWLGLLLGVVLAAAGLAAASWLVDLMGPSAPVRAHALTYFRISMAGIPSLLVVLAGTGYLRGVQDTRTPLYVVLVTVIANLALEVLFVYGLSWGVAGSAWGTVLAQTGGACWYVVVVVRSARRASAGLRPSATLLRRLLRVSVALLLRTAALRASLLVLTAVVSRLGTDEIAAQQVVFELWTFLALVLDAIAIAGQTMTGRLLGAGDVDGARAATRRMIELSVVAGIVLAMVVLGLRPWLPALFTPDDDVQALAAFVLLFVALQQPINGVTFALDGVLIGAGDGAYLARAMTLSTLVFVPLAMAVSSLDGGIGWVWSAFTVMQVVRLATLVWRWRGSAWMVTGAER